MVAAAVEATGAVGPVAGSAEAVAAGTTEEVRAEVATVGGSRAAATAAAATGVALWAEAVRVGAATATAAAEETHRGS